MEASKEELEALLARVESATGPDRDLDAALFVALNKPEQQEDDLRYYRLPHVSMDHMDMCAPGTYWLKQRSGASLHTSPTYTASLDAASALVERVMPGSDWAAHSHTLNTPPHKHAWGAVRELPNGPVSGVLHESNGYTPALALLAALLLAALLRAKAQGAQQERPPQAPLTKDQAS